MAAREPVKPNRPSEGGAGSVEVGGVFAAGCDGVVTGGSSSGCLLSFFFLFFCL